MTTEEAPMDLTVLIGTDEGLREVGGPERAQLAGHAIAALAHERRRWWAAVDERTIRARDGDGAWADVATVGDGTVTCLLPTPTGLLVGTSGARLLRLVEGRLVPNEPFVRVEGREAWHTPWGDPPDTRSLTRGPDGALYANVHVGGVVRSTDEGRTWAPTLDIDLDVHQVLADPGRPGRVFAAAAVGLVVSEDGGAHWRTETDGLHAPYCRAVALADGALLLSASTGPGGRRAAVYRRPLDGGTSFERCREGLPQWFGDNVDTYCLVASGQTVVLGTGDGRVYRSADAGRTWSQAAKGYPPITCVALA
jgi:hypothetical protein